MDKLQKLPIGIQNFEGLRRDGYLYIDKTYYIHELVENGKYYFLSRPRRFGKSLLLSTIQAYFEGKRELFEGTYLGATEQNWVQYPVLHLDLNTESYTSPESLTNKLDVALSAWEALYGRNPCEKSPGTRFEGVIRRAAEQAGRRVVILVDEYDKPVLQAIENEALQDEFRATLRGFYGALKSMDAHIRFAFLTGVTKFGKVSIFSDLNNLEDISMTKAYAAVCGITDQELDRDFTPYTVRLAHELELSVDEVREELRRRYNGYRFIENGVAVYNPFSVMSTFKNNRFSNYWFQTGTPSYLVYLLKRHNYNLAAMASVETSRNVLYGVDSQSTDPIPVIYQSGYLTIKDYNSRFNLYKLGFPNEEVEEGFLNYLMPSYTQTTSEQSSFSIMQFVIDVERGNVDDFLQRLSGLFSDTPYELVRDVENHYQNIIFIVAKLMGFYVKAEYHTSQGRIDLVLQTRDYTYVMEFKFDGSAEEALRQIHDKNYALPFVNDSRKLYLIGINFSRSTRNIERWVVERSE
jgi:hypothetical protein